MALLRALDEVAGAAGAVSFLAVPEGDQGHVLAALGEGVVEHPQVVALPDVVVGFLGEPPGQLLRLGEHAPRQPVEQAVEALAPVAAGGADRFGDEFALGKSEKELSRDSQLGANLMKQ